MSSLIFRAPDCAIKLALAKLKSDGIVHPEATFNPNAPEDLRREVTYYDRDFLSRLGRTTAETEIVASALSFLVDYGIVTDGSGYNEAAVSRHRAEITSSFVGTWTSLTPAMERLLYMLTSVKRPKQLIELGSFWGYTLAWFAGPCIGTNKQYAAERIIGIDIDEAAMSQARKNFSKLPHIDSIELLTGDAREVLSDLPGPFDFVYIESKSDETKGLYLSLLKQIEEKLSPGAWVIAHDSLDWSFASEMAEYLPYVRESGRFRYSIGFEIDSCGLELSIK